VCDDWMGVCVMIGCGLGDEYVCWMVLMMDEVMRGWVMGPLECLSKGIYR
jgi:hypothetical protein